MVDTLSALATRPPTPPRTSSRLEPPGQAGNRPGSTDILPGTPDESPSSSQVEFTGSQQRTGSKRVDFSPWKDYIKPLSFSKSNLHSKSPLKILRPSNECKPTKSILKTSAAPLPQSLSDPLRPNEPENLVTMWESAVQQLSGESRDSRLDAYKHLFNALKAYNGLLDDNGIAEKIRLITHYIQRDIRQESGEYETLDINLVTYALKLLTVLVWNPQLATHLPDDVRSFVIDRATSALQEPKTPKSIISHYMHLLSTQTFQQKIMTGNRASKLLTNLQNITVNVNGNAVIAQRLMIYQRLLTQCKSSMATHANMWVQHLLTGLFHHIKDTRTKAVAFGLHAATTFGPNASISNAVRTTLSTPMEDGRKYLSEMIEDMMRMISSREKGVHVPQIWSIIILLLRTRKSPVEQWEHFKDLLLVIQKCFNCSDSTIKTQAILAWNRFVYAVSPSESTGQSMVRMLSKPILSQIERRKIEKLGTQPNSTALSSYCNLLYYAFRPSASHEQLDLFWKEYVLPPFSTVFNFGPTINDRASQILSSLLWNPQLKVWSENRANDATKLEPDELPVLDCKWVRSRVSTVLQVFESLFETSMWREDDLDASNIALAWIGFSKALGEASSKEIKPSTESMHAIANILDMFQRLWKRGPAALNVGPDCGNDAFLDRFRFLSKTIVSSLGPIPFTENLLLKSSSKGAFQTTNTPTHRRPRSEGNCKTPILHFLQLISTLPTGVRPGPAYRLLISEILEICSHARSTRGSRLELFRQFTELHLHNASNDLDSNAHSARYVWEVTADLVEKSLITSSPDTTKDRGNALSRDHVNLVVKILESGIRFGESSFSEWSRLTDAFVAVVQSERKEDFADTIIEPLSESLLNQNVTAVVRPTQVLLKLAVQPGSQTKGSHSPCPPKFYPYIGQQVDHSQIGYGKLMNLTEKALKGAYQQYEDFHPSTLSSFIEAVDYSLSNCPPDFRPSALERLQSGISLWLADRDHHISAAADVEDRKPLIAVRTLSQNVVSILEKLPEHDSQQLERFEVLISSSLGTFHKSIANSFIVMWNNTFGCQSYLEYPKSVELALRKLEPFVDLQLPSFPQSTDFEEGEPTPPEFLSSQEYLTNRATQMRSFDQQKLVSSPLNLVLSSRVNSSSPANRSGYQAVSPSKRSAATTPKSRRRHDDSQVEFVAVESSPAQHGPESQYLTEHQKDIKERQRNETTAMFPEFKSSSPAVGKLTPGKLRGESGLRTETSRDSSDDMPGDAPMTPTIAATMAENEEEFPVSSPTPTSQNPKGLPVGDFSEPSSCPTNEDIDALESLDPPSSPPDSHSRRPDTGSASKSGLQPPEIEPDSQESQIQGSVENTEEMTPTAEPATGHSEADGRESAREYSSQGGFQQPNRPESEDLDSERNNEEVTGIVEPVKQPTDLVLAESTPDLTHVSLEFSQTVDRGTPSQSKSTRAVDMVPDSFVSEFDDDQVASQLGQDLQLAVVLGPKEKEKKKEKKKEKEKKESPKKKKLSALGKRARKRLREQETEVPPSPKRIRTRSTGSVEFKGLKTGRVNVPESTPTPKPAAAISSLSKAESKAQTPKSATGTRRTRSKVKESRTPTAKAQKRTRSPEADDEHEESRMTDSMSNPPSLKKRRSSRQAGQPVLSDVSNDGRKTRRKQKEARERSQASARAQTPTPRTEEEIKDIVSQQDVGGGDKSVVANGRNGMEVVVNNTEFNSIVSATTPATPRLISQGTQTDMAAGQEAEASEAGILNSLKRVFSVIRTATLGRPALREIDDVMFDIRMEAHDANRRHGE